MSVPIFHEHEQDSLIPPGYGIKSYNEGFYPYRIAAAGFPVYLTRNGLDVRCESYEQALEYVAEVAD